MKKYNRVFVIVIDSMGIGNAPDAAAFGDEGADTFGHIAEEVGTFLIPNLLKWESQISSPQDLSKLPLPR